MQNDKVTMAVTEQTLVIPVAAVAVLGKMAVATQATGLAVKVELV
jgi:hypothetical protein